MSELERLMAFYVPRNATGQIKWRARAWRTMQATRREYGLRAR